MNIRSALPSPIGSIPKHLQTRISKDTPWYPGKHRLRPPPNNVRRGHYVVPTPADPRTAQLGDLWRGLHPPLPNTQVDPTPRLRPDPPSQAPSPPWFQSACSTASSRSPSGRTPAPGPYRRMWVTAALEPSKGSQGSSKNQRGSRGGGEVQGAARQTPSFLEISAGYLRDSKNLPS